MAVHNWVRCHWRNGRHELHDLPNEWRAVLEDHLSRQRTRTDDLGVVRVASTGALAVAWVECEVPLGAGECGFSYRRARALHALVRPMASGGAWDLPEAESLFGQRYGESVERGLAAQHRALSSLTFPDDAAKALGLFVGRDAPLPSEVVQEAPVPPQGALEETEVPPEKHTSSECSAAAPVLVRGDDEPPALERWLQRFTFISRREATPTDIEPLGPDVAPLAGGSEPPATVAAEVEAPDAVALDLEAEAPDELALDSEAEGRDELALHSEDEAPDEIARDSAEEVPDEIAVDSEAEGPDEIALDSEAEGPDEIAVGAEDESPDDGEADPLVLFDLSTPPADRPAAPASSLSGLLGPSHTTVI